MSDSRLQEIVTRAVVGRAERRFSWCHAFAADGITNVLGVRVGNTGVQVQEDNGSPIVDLTVDCELWCSDERKTKVIRTSARWTQRVPVSMSGEVLGERDMRVSLLSKARSAGVKVVDGEVRLNLEADVGVEIAALTRLWIKAYTADLMAEEPHNDASDNEELGAVASTDEP